MTRTEVGRVDDAANTRALRVFYNPDKCSYKALLGVYWRHVDPTRATQFPLDASEEGDAFRTVIWVADAEERKLAEQSRKVMEAAEVYGKNKEIPHGDLRRAAVHADAGGRPGPLHGGRQGLREGHQEERPRQVLREDLRARHDDGVRGEDVRLRLLSVLRRERVHGDRVGTRW